MKFVSLANLIPTLHFSNVVINAPDYPLRFDRRWSSPGSIPFCFQSSQSQSFRRPIRQPATTKTPTNPAHRLRNCPDCHPEAEQRLQRRGILSIQVSDPSLFKSIATIYNKKNSKMTTMWIAYLEQLRDGKRHQGGRIRSPEADHPR